ncbi:hypothetical protein L1276_002587 [Flavobacterium sp. HSC-32F16]|uniref:hypothetical protein n=1 Tax=Flavobacterium sp. HSC-32F16 TaxID=2910964 RepID=UPI0020A26E15|nr:hypothetical protein [Flavobacterium sp. HSC-32F16]MCP2027430.1 hypothetical protein [Flavobacterium sp. HSC-32F16]
MKVLAKSRFKLGLECPNKLYYTGKKEYANKKQEDPFLLVLADGGFQIEEYVQMHYDNPHKKLPNLFEDLTAEELHEVVSGGVEELADGGETLTAYGKIQYTDISDAELSTALLKYCKLDTFEMVMLYEHLKKEVENGYK